MTAPPSLDYETRPVAPTRDLFSISWASGALVVVLFSFATLLVFVPPFLRIFSDFKMDVPWSTRVVFIAYNLTSHPIGVAFAASPLLLGLLAPVIRRRTGRPPLDKRSRRLLVLSISIFCIGVLALFLAAALSLPLFSLVSGIAQSK